MAGRFGPFIRHAAGSAARPTRRGTVSLLFALGVMVLPFAAMGSPGQSGSSIPTLPAGSTVELNDDDAGQALFDLPAMEPGHPVSRCIAVTYAGSAEVPVELYGAVTGNGLDRYLT